VGKKLIIPNISVKYATLFEEETRWLQRGNRKCCMDFDLMALTKESLGTFGTDIFIDYYTCACSVFGSVIITNVTLKTLT
jgi:hypothetical protein